MTADTDNLEALLRGRYSCRAFKPDPVPRETIERLAATAQRTPSWCNSQPWQLAVASAPTTERLRAQLLDHVHSHPPWPDFTWPLEYRGVYRQRRRECGLQLYQAVGVERGDRDAAEKQRLRTSVSSVLRMSRLSAPKRSLESMAPSTAAPMSTI